MDREELPRLPAAITSTTQLSFKGLAGKNFGFAIDSISVVDNDPGPPDPDRTAALGPPGHRPADRFGALAEGGHQLLVGAHLRELLEQPRGVVRPGSGLSHAQAVAYHAASLGIPASVVMPEVTIPAGG